MASANETVASPAAGAGLPAGAALPALPALDNTFGALFLGTCFGLIMYGLTVHQVYRYYRQYPTDSTHRKVFVLVAFLVETLHSVCTIHLIYHYLVNNYFNPAELANDVWSLRTLTWVSGLAIVLSQSFYARRIYKIGEGWRFLVAVAAILIVVEIGFIAAATAEGFILATLAEYRKFAWLVSVVYGVTVFCDILLTGSLTWVLLKKRTGFKNTDSLIGVIVLYTINTGLLTGIFGLLVFVFALVMPDNLVYIGISLFGAKLYINSVLAVLNSRKSLNSKNTGFELNTFDNDGFPGSSGGTRSRSTHLGSTLRVGPGVVSKPTHIDIHVKQEANRSAEDGLGDELPMHEYK